MSGIPNTWSWSTINKVSVKVTDGTHHSPKNFATGEYKYLTAKNVRVGRLELDDITYIPKQVHDEIYSRCDVQLNDVLLVKDGVNTGMSAVNTLDEPFSLLSHVGVVRPAACLSPHYLAHWFNGPAARQVMADQVAGVAITRMTLEKINAFPIPLAPRREQDRIVAALDERLSELDASLASLERAERNLVRYRAAVLAAACSGKLVPTEADLARDWAPRDRGPLARLEGERPSGPRSQGYEPADQLLARILAERRKANTKAKYEEPAQPDTSKLPKLPEGWVWPTVDQVIREPLRNGHSAKATGGPGIRTFTLSAVTEGDMPKIDQSAIEHLPFPLPPAVEQKRIVAEVDRHLSRADALAVSIAQSKRRAQRLRRAILAAAFQGRLVPQDPNDEPASVLLDRIRSQVPLPGTARGPRASKAAPERASGARSQGIASTTTSAMTPKRRGRPPGSKNKAKA